MIGSGLYDATEVALLCGLAPDQVVRWSTSSTHGDGPTAFQFWRRTAIPRAGSRTLLRPFKQVRNMTAARFAHHRQLVPCSRHQRRSRKALG